MKDIQTGRHFFTKTLRVELLMDNRSLLSYRPTVALNSHCKCIYYSHNKCELYSGRTNVVCASGCGKWARKSWHSNSCDSIDAHSERRMLSCQSLGYSSQQLDYRHSTTRLSVVIFTPSTKPKSQLSVTIDTHTHTHTHSGSATLRYWIVMYFKIVLQGIICIAFLFFLPILTKCKSMNIFLF